MKNAAFLLAGAIVVSPAATGPAWAFVNGKTFLTECLDASEAVQRAECRGYIAAVADAINSNLVKGKRVCFPATATPEDVRAEVSRWVRENAHVVRRMQGFGAVYAALIKTYPCKK